MPLHLEVAECLGFWVSLALLHPGALGWDSWNSTMSSGEHSKLFWGSHSFSEFGQPENLTKYQSFPYLYLESRILSTSYSSSPSITSGPGWGSAACSTISSGR